MGELGIVITTVQGQGMYLPLLMQVLASTDNNSDIMLVDDGQNGEEVPLHKAVKYISTGERMKGFASAVNLGVSNLNGEKYIVLLHDDIRLGEDFSFQPFIDKLNGDDSIGAIVPLMHTPRHTITESFCSFVSQRNNQLIKAGFTNWYPEYPPANEEQFVDLLKSPFIFLRREAFDKIGGYDEAYNPFGFEDFDLSMKLRSEGFNLLYMPSVRVIHLAAQTINSDYDLPTEINEVMAPHLNTFKERWNNSSLIEWKEIPT